MSSVSRVNLRGFVVADADDSDHSTASVEDKVSRKAEALHNQLVAKVPDCALLCGQWFSRNTLDMYEELRALKRCYEGEAKELVKRNTILIFKKMLAVAGTPLKADKEATLTVARVHKWLEKDRSRAEPRFQQITDLDLSHCGLKGPLPRILQFLPKLRSVNLSHNELNFIPQEAFLNLEQLRRVNLSHNRLATFDQRVLANLNISYSRTGIVKREASIREIDLSYNQLQALSGGVAGKAHVVDRFRLERLNLSHNQLTGIAGDFPDLKTLDLSYNEFEKAPGPSTGQCGLKVMELETLDLTHNKIEAIKAKDFYTLGSLLTLSLKDNAISTFYKASFVGLNALQTLDLRGNPFASLEEGTPALEKLKKLQRLKIELAKVASLSEAIRGKVEVEEASRPKAPKRRSADAAGSSAKRARGGAPDSGRGR